MTAGPRALRTLNHAKSGIATGDSSSQEEDASEEMQGAYLLHRGFQPQPELYDAYMVNNYALPKGLSAQPRQVVHSESEKLFVNRYRQPIASAQLCV